VAASVTSLDLKKTKNSNRLSNFRSRIALLINAAETDHKQLLIQMDMALSIAYEAGREAAVEMARIQAAITEISQGLLKRERKRVKAGEPV
jgi:hypothetical protein